MSILKRIKHLYCGLFAEQDNNNLLLQLNDLRSIILNQKKEIAALVEKLDMNENINSDGKQLHNVLDLMEKNEFDAFYMAFEDHFRGSHKEIQNRLEFYLPWIAKIYNGNSSDGLILDIGCGRGEWLELLKNKGYCALGVDTNQVALARCREMGLRVIESDVLEYLQASDIGSFSAITGFHLIEHLPIDTLLKLMQETFRLLKPGGLVIFETPDPENVIVGTRNFNIDPTHRNPIPDETLSFIVRYSGFENIEILKLHPISDPPTTQNPHLNEIQRRFFMSQDYAVIGFKPK